jgi:uncharacterized membrane protein
MLLALVGCGVPEQEVAEIKKKADEKFAKAEREGKQKLEEAEKQIEKLKAELNDARSKSEKALADDSEQTKAVEAALEKARQAFKTAARLELANANKQFAEVSSKAGKVPAKAKVAFQKSMQTVGTKQKAVAKDIADFDNATLESLTKVKAQLDKDLAQLKVAIAQAKAKIPP